jgi:hypothetical protein
MSEGVRNLLIGLIIMNIVMLPLTISLYYYVRKDVARLKAGPPLCSRCYAPLRADRASCKSCRFWPNEH